MRKSLVTAFALAAIVLLATPAFAAGSATNPLGLTATVINNCTITTTPVAFGNYDPLSASPSQASGTVAITCTKSATTTITLGDGNNGTRQMKDGGSQLMAYELYQPPDSTPGTSCSYGSPTRWGTTSGQVFTPAAAPSKLARTYNVCGQVAAGLDLAAGSFADSVVATINF
jgi:spore coat protein U-like protein